MAPTTARKQTTPKAAEKAAAPAFDFTAVTVQDAPVPTREGAVAPKDNPAVAWITQSWQNATGPNASGIRYGSGKKIVVPTEAAAKQATALIRQAALAHGKAINERLGVAIKVSQSSAGFEVAFAAKTAKTFAPRKKSATAPATSA